MYLLSIYLGGEMGGMKFARIYFFACDSFLQS